MSRSLRRGSRPTASPIALAGFLVSLASNRRSRSSSLPIWSQKPPPRRLGDPPISIDLSAAYPELIDDCAKAPAEIRGNRMPIEEISDGLVGAEVNQHQIGIVAKGDLSFSAIDTEPSSDV